MKPIYELPAIHAFAFEHVYAAYAAWIAENAGGLIAGRARHSVQWRVMGLRYRGTLRAEERPKGASRRVRQRQD